MSEQNYLSSPEAGTPAPPRITPRWVALPLGIVFILVFGILALSVVVAGAIVTTVVTILFILFLIPVLLIGLVLGLIEDRRGRKTTVPKGVKKTVE